MNVATCPGQLLEHADGTTGGCTLDKDEGCKGLELRHAGDPVRCWMWMRAGCNYCAARFPD